MNLITYMIRFDTKFVILIINFIDRFYHKMIKAQNKW